MFKCDILFKASNHTFIYKFRVIPHIGKYYFEAYSQLGLIIKK